MASPAAAARHRDPGDRPAGPPERRVVVIQILFRVINRVFPAFFHSFILNLTL
ncbi:MAG: hypothetical protein AVDCRST_MAG56-1314 [uncultured Cytophagales bacterium]|uniref:Uncharacterized protein n=1 Tax=uncultured Cytophagales bacterium TaxID=158755 RepID=A0A6J4I1W5_9SPHI|nr:MAG: hypothetical protein AVDCRST_MAG56-1314 [uncultured Cytophagales bacterium]